MSGKAMFKLLKTGYSTLLYPGGAREALHRKVLLNWPVKTFENIVFQKILIFMVK